MSQGAAAAVAFAVHHPQRVSHLVLYGGYAQGVARRGDEGAERRYQAMIELAGHGWGSQNSTFRQVFTSRFIPGATDEQVRWFNELCAKTASPQNAVRLFEARATVDVTDLLPRVRTPTLVLHARDDGVTPIAQGRLLASSIPGAEFVELDSRNHILLEAEPAWRRFQEAVLDWMQTGAAPTPGVFDSLSAREREVLALMGDGLGNADIAERLKISEKTVRNHASNIFDKLGVWSRAQAIVFARDRGFRG
jgi:DNA-binding CsgD family transcriptional regulator/pimeloyl-ACP methyl ester carboxylesterase